MTTRTGRGNGRMQGRKEGRKEGSMRQAREYANDCSYGISAARAHVTFVGVVVPRWGSGRSYWPRPAPTLHTLCRRLEKSSTAPNMAIDAPRSVLGRANDAFLASCCPPGCRWCAVDTAMMRCEDQSEPSGRDRLDERISSHSEGTKEEGVSLRLQFDDEKDDTFLSFFFQTIDRLVERLTERTKGKLYPNWGSSITSFIFFQAFQIIPDSNSRENWTEYSSSIRVLIKDNSIESRRGGGDAQRTTAPRFFRGGIFLATTIIIHPPIHFGTLATLSYSSESSRKRIRPSLLLLLCFANISRAVPIARAKRRGKAKKRVGGGKKGGRREGRKGKKKRERKEKRKRGGGGKGEKAGRGQKDSSEIKNGQAVGRVRVAIL